MNTLIVREIPGLDVRLQKALAELVMIRLFDDFMESIAGIAYRLACGSSYVDGTSVRLLVSPARSSASARNLYRNHNRGAGKYFEPKWSLSSNILKTTKFVLDPQDPFVAAANAHSLIIADMQSVRNRIAHKNSTSLNKYNTVLRRHYGGTPKGVTPGQLLLTPRVNPPLLSQYLTSASVVIRDFAQA